MLLSFSGLLATKSISLNNESCLAKSSLIDALSQGLHQYPFMIGLDKCGGGCNTVHDLSSRVCVSNKTEDVNVNLFNMITGINESKALKYISCNYRRKFNGRESNVNQRGNNNNSRCECKNPLKHRA